MKVQDEQPCQASVRAILDQPNNRESVVRSLLEALQAFGYSKTLDALQAESKIILHKERVAAIESQLANFQYRKVRQQIDEIELNSEMKKEVLESIDELEVTLLLSQGKVEQALSVVGELQVDEERRLKFYEMIALESPAIDEKEVAEKHHCIVQKCRQQKESKNNKNNLATYLLSSSLPARRVNDAPQTVIAHSEGELYLEGRANFIKFNCSANKLVVVAETDKDYEVSVWVIEHSRIIKSITFKERRGSTIAAVQWSTKEIRNGQLIGVCFYNELIIFTDYLTVICRIERFPLNLPKFLSFSWHPTTQVAYVGGVFAKLIGFDCAGKIVNEVYSFGTSRKLVFSPRGELFSIAATGKGQLVRYSLEKERVEREFTHGSLLMDLKWSDGKVVVSSRDLIIVLNADTLEPLFTCDSPPNEKLLIIEVFLSGHWLILFNQKLRGTLEGDNSVRQLKWQNCDAVDVQGEKMATIRSSIEVWASEGTAKMQYTSVQGSSSSSSSDSEMGEEEERQMEVEYMNEAFDHSNESIE